jgi:hypothetical protein
MRQIERFSAYEITSRNNICFLPDEYSKFKYGSISIARKYGYDLANKFINEFKSVILNRKLLIVPSAFSHIKTASGIMTEHFIDRLNYFLIKNSCPRVEQTKIYRTVTYRDDYGEMTAEDRYNLIKGDTFYIDKGFLTEKLLIFIDDIRVTGTHERIIIKMLDQYEIRNDCIMLYFASIENSGINPNIENYLNQYTINNLFKIDELIRNEDLQFNTRVVKYILNSTFGEFVIFINQQSLDLLKKLYFLAIGNSYEKFECYSTNLNYLENLIIKLDNKFSILEIENIEHTHSSRKQVETELK